MEIIQEVKYDETMKATVEPYLKQRCISGYRETACFALPGRHAKRCDCDLSWIYGILSEI